MSIVQETDPVPGPDGAWRELFHPAVAGWFDKEFPAPTRPQTLAWPAIARGGSTLVLAPTGSGKTLAAFLYCIERLMFAAVPPAGRRCRVLYISPIKALAVDIEKNLRAPLAGIAQAARNLGMAYHEPTVSIRTGDTLPAERARFRTHPADILITTPESIYLLLTSKAREALRFVETVVIDEIHALVPSKRGSHLALSLERLEHLCDRPLQRIGLSATQRPLEEVARYLGGASRTACPKEQISPPGESEGMLSEFDSGPSPGYRPVATVDASQAKRLDLRVEVPVEDMARLDELDPVSLGLESKSPVRPSIWSAIHPQLLALVRSHRSTLIFVNSRRLAERISGAINELAGETLVRAHHGSVAPAQRKEIEDRLKTGALRGLVATSSLELGIDMGAIDLVVQVESPPSVASGTQRVGRSGHQVEGLSKAVIFPKYRSDLLACAAVTHAMYAGNVESVRYPRNPLDVLAQQIVAMVALDSWDAAELFAVVRQAAPYAALTGAVFDQVLDMLSGRYPSDEFAELRPRLTWDRVAGRLSAREGARAVAIINGGTIPDRGLFGVFLSGAVRGARVGELDEEMVFESRVGDCIVLGASTWRIEQITHDRVVVSAAPGEPGKMPFWRGDSPGRPYEFGQQIGRMTRELARLARPAAFAKLVEDHGLDGNAAENLLRFLDDQTAATGCIPSDEDIIVERCRDEMGDWRICVLTPFGSAVHAPWCMAVTAKLKAARGLDAESMWSDDGFVLRLADGEQPVAIGLLLLSPLELKELVLRQLGSTSLFAAKFREAASRSLLLPRRRPGKRAPLWQQRKRAADLLALASEYPSFPILLEAYRECIRDVFDLSAATEVLNNIQQGSIRVTTVDSRKPSPFASSLLFSYIANYIYDGDAPLAERRAQALSIDSSQLQELLGDSDLRELLDRSAVEDVEAKLQSLHPDFRARHADALHDLLLKLGDLSAQEIAARSAPDAGLLVRQLVDAGRALPIRIAGESRYIAIEHAARYRLGLGVALPPGVPGAFLQAIDEPLVELARRFAKTHGPFTSSEMAERFALQVAEVDPVLRTLHLNGRLLEGEFRPGGAHREWCDPDVLGQIRRKSLARLRREVEPVDQATFARWLTRWQGVMVRRRGIEALLDAIEMLQGVPLLASDLESAILPARVTDYRSGDLDALMAAGEVVWVGVERKGDRDGRIALYLSQSLPLLLANSVSPPVSPPVSGRGEQIVSFLSRQGASFFASVHEATGGGFPNDTMEALWELVWAGLLTNDTLHPLRSLLYPPETKRALSNGSEARPGSVEFLRHLRLRRAGSGVADGRWSLVVRGETSPTQWTANVAQQILARHGIVTRETALAENIPGGYNTLYPAFRAMEESGRIRRGMFVAGLGAAQFAMPAAIDMLRGLRTQPAVPDLVHLASSDPANPYGAVLPWPRAEDDGEGAGPHSMTRAAGASVILLNGRLTGFLRRRSSSIRIFLPDDEPEASQFARGLANKLAEIALERQTLRQGLFIEKINDLPAHDHFLGRFLEPAGFVKTMTGFQMRRVARSLSPVDAGFSETEDEVDAGEVGAGEVEESA